MTARALHHRRPTVRRMRTVKGSRRCSARDSVLFTTAVFWILSVALQLAHLMQMPHHRPSVSRQQQQDSSIEAVNNDYEPYCPSEQNDDGELVFVDVGALDGDTLDVHRRLRPNATSYKCFAWECNANNVVRLTKWLQTYGKDLNVQVIDKAAWIQNTTLQFDSTVANAGKVLMGNETSLNEGKSTSVQALDLAEWIMNSFRKSDFVFVKMDIETAEFQVLPHLFQSGAMEYIDELQIEWHDWQEFRTDERVAHRARLEEQLVRAGFGNVFATFDMEMQGVDNVEFQKVPKYYNSTSWPHPWVDMHYFRRANGCRSPWDVLQNNDD